MTPMIKTYALTTGVDDDSDSSSDDDSYSSSDSDSSSSDDDSMPGLMDPMDSDDDDSEADPMETDDDDSVPGLIQRYGDESDDDSSDSEDEDDDPPMQARTVRFRQQPEVQQYNPRRPAANTGQSTSQPIPSPLRRSQRGHKPREFLEPKMKGQEHSNTTKHLFTQWTIKDPATYLEHKENEAHLIAEIFVQTFSLPKAVKKFGKPADEAAVEELKQLHDRGAWHPVDISKYPPQVKKQVMESLMFLVEKRDGRIKARHCSNGSIQRNWFTKEDATSPTAHQESVVITAAIDAMEGREVAIADIPNAFIQTDNETVEEAMSKGRPPPLMKVRGRVVDMLVRIAPTIYKPFIVYERGQPVVYLLLTKAVYGQIQSALRFFRKLVGDLTKAGFKANDYDMCVYNKTVDGKQLTVVIHVDDLKISHVDKRVVDNFISWCRSKYENFTKMKPSRGKIHDYLGVTLDYSEPGKVKLYMHDYVKSVLKEFPYQEELKKTKSPKTPAAEHLFQIDPDAVPLDKEKADVFHTTVAKLLFLTMRTRPDLQPTVPFLCTRVQKPDVDDFKKLLRALKWLEKTWKFVLTIEVTRDGEVILVCWFPDAAFAVHVDFKSHTGGTGTMGKGVIKSISCKQKLNTKSSTEAELVAADDVVPSALWTRLFLLSQGYKSKTTLFQDNTSAILLEKNGTKSSSKRTRHLNIRYFFITDCYSKDLLGIEHCSTENMQGDYPSKPLQGKPFEKHLLSIMNMSYEVFMAIMNGS